MLKMDLKENVINFFSILALLRGPIWPDLACGPLIDSIVTSVSWVRLTNNIIYEII